MRRGIAMKICSASNLSTPTSVFLYGMDSIQGIAIPIGQPAVSKRISALEDELGAELIHRTSRSIALTDPGRDFYESALRLLDDFENATSRIGRGQTAPKGLIR